MSPRDARFKVLQTSLRHEFKRVQELCDKIEQDIKIWRALGGSIQRFKGRTYNIIECYMRLYSYIREEKKS